MVLKSTNLVSTVLSMGGAGGGGVGCTHLMHIIKTVDPRIALIKTTDPCIPTMSEINMSGFHRLGRQIACTKRAGGGGGIGRVHSFA